MASEGSRAHRFDNVSDPIVIGLSSNAGPSVGLFALTLNFQMRVGITYTRYKRLSEGLHIILSWTGATAACLALRLERFFESEHAFIKSFADNDAVDPATTHSPKILEVLKRRDPT